MSIRLSVFGLVLLIGCLMIVSSSTAEEWIVDDEDGPWVDYLSIQEAVNQSKSGDLIRVYGGDYYENILLNSSITLIGNGTNSRIIGNSETHVIQINANGTTIDSFRIQNSGYPFSGIYAESNMNTVRNNYFTDNHNGVGLTFSDNNSVINNYFYANGQGIRTYGSDNNTFKMNICRGSNWAGIVTHQSNNNLLIYNICVNGEDGIYLNDFSNNNRVCFNKCINDQVTGRRGITIAQSSSNNSIQNNTINMYQHGFYVYKSIINVIENNSIINNNIGILFSNSTGSHNPENNDCNNNTFQYNNIENNTEYGVYLEEGISNNKIFRNNFFHNTIQATDYGSDNKWDMDNYGNYWNDYDGVDENDDHIGDTPYELSGTANSKDMFPLVIPFQVNVNISTPEPNLIQPIALIESVHSKTYIEGEEITFSGASITFTDIDLWVWKSNQSGEIYNGTENFFSIHNLPNGTHNISLKVITEGLWSKPVSRIILVNGIPLIMNLRINTTPIRVGETVNITPIIRDDGIITQYNWSVELPDGNTTHQYNTAVLDFNYSVVGWYRIMLLVIDEHGVASDESETSLYVNMIPGVFITSLQRYQKLNGTVSIIGYAVDENPNTLEFVEIAIDDGNWIKVSGVENWIYQWNTTIWDGTSLEDGSHLVKARSFDGMHYSDNASIYIILDNIPDDVSSDGGGDDGIPGFGLPVFMLGLIILVGLMRKRGH